jgi:hypothetical protein
MKYLVLIMIALFIVGCGVESASSDSQKSSQYDDGTGDDGTTDGGSTDGDGTTDGGTDDGTTDDGTTDDGTTDDGTTDGTTGGQLNSDFDMEDAIEDPNACIINGTFKNGMDDSSFDPEETLDSDNGIAVSSFLAYDPDAQKTLVTIYYPDLSSTPVGNQIVITETKYRVGFDQAWPTNSNKTIYVRTPRYLDSNYYGCYRYTLSLDKASMVAQKVYRFRD